MNAPLFALMSLAAAAAIALLIFLGALFLAPVRAALRLGGAGLLGGGISFAGTALAMLPFHNQAFSSQTAAYDYFGPALLAGLVGGVLCAVMIFRLSKRKPETTT